MDWYELIGKNKMRASALFSCSSYHLPHSDAKNIRLKEKKFQSSSLMTANIPEVKSSSTFQNKKKAQENIYPIAPAPVIDKRSDRAKERGAENRPAPKPHRQWYNYCTLTGHNAWVRAVAVDPSNDFFITGSTDRMLKIWDLAKAELRLTLTGHIGAIHDLKISSKSPYLFSCCDAKCVYCWDLNRNVIVRDFHGHLSGVYCLALHPQLDIFVTGARDSTARIWDIRTRQTVFVLEGHDMTVFDVLMQEQQPNIVTASADATVRTWDLRMNGKCTAVLTRHKKGVRALAAHPTEWSYVSASRDNIFQWNGENSIMFKRFVEHPSIVNALAINESDVMVSVADDGTIQWWDWGSGQCFQKTRTIPHPGSLDSECGIFDVGFDMTGTRMITCEADKTVKLWREFNEDGKPY